MKKFIRTFLLVLVVLIVLAVLGVHFFLDAVIKKGVETVGPQVTKVSVRLDGVSLSLLSGSGKIKGLVVGNPPGFKTPSAIKVGLSQLSLKPMTILEDKVVVSLIKLEAPEVTMESDLTSINLKKILDNLQESAGTEEKKPAEPAPAPGEKPPKKLQVDEFVITGGKVHVSVNTPIGAQSATVPLPEIRFIRVDVLSDKAEIDGFAAVKSSRKN